MNGFKEESYALNYNRCQLRKKCTPCNKVFVLLFSLHNKSTDSMDIKYSSGIKVI